MWMRVRPTTGVRDAGRQRDAAAGRERPLVLRNLVALRQVRIEVVLPREDRPRLHRAAERERRAHRQLDRASVEHRQRAGQAEADRAHVRVRRRAERRRTPAEDLGGGQQLRVDLEADDGLVLDSRHDGNSSFGVVPRSTFPFSSVRTANAERERGTGTTRSLHADAFRSDIPSEWHVFVCSRPSSRSASRPAVSTLAPRARRRLPRRRSSAFASTGASWPFRSKTTSWARRLSEVTPVGADPAAVARIFEVQTVLARTYAVAHLGRHQKDGFDLCDTTHCQLYQPARIKTSRFAEAARHAVERTRGVVLMFSRGRPRRSTTPTAAGTRRRPTTSGAARTCRI